MAQATNLRELLILREKNNAYLQSINKNLGSALGLKNGDGDPCVIVFVPRKVKKKWLSTSALIKDKLEMPGGLWCPLDVVEGSKQDLLFGNEPAFVDVGSPYPLLRRTARTYSRDDIIGPPELSSPGRVELREQLRGWSEKISPGAQVYHGDGWFGTLGCFARDSAGDVGLITNQHVAGNVGDNLFYPERGGVPLATVTKAFEYLADEVRFPGIVNQPEDQYRVDCAFAKLHVDRVPDDVEPRFPILNQNDAIKHKKLGDPLPLDLDTMGPIGQRVISAGRTRSFQRGTIGAFAYSFDDSEWYDRRKFTDYLIIGEEEQGEQFSDKGDSGKLIITDDGEHRPVALLWGGWKEKLRPGRMQEKWTYAIDINKVLELLDVSILKTI